MILVVIDVDRFKEINDTHGHLAGDEVIRMLSRMMAAELGELGYLGRIGGDEFAIVGSRIEKKNLVACLGAFHARLGATPIVACGIPVAVTISAGVAIRTPDQSLSDLYAEADRALYTAKSLGRNRVSYSPSFEASITPSVPDSEDTWRADMHADRRNPGAKDDLASVA